MKVRITGVIRPFQVWRCFVLWNRRYYIILLPILLLVAGTVLASNIRLYMMRLNMLHNDTTLELPPEWTRLQKQVNAMSTAMFVTSCATNVLMSGMIAFRIWQCTRLIGQRKSRYLRIAYLMYGAVHHRDINSDPHAAVSLETVVICSVCLVFSALFSSLKATASVGPFVLAYSVCNNISQQVVVRPPFQPTQPLSHIHERASSRLS
ncbi:hypothetical protein OE88DRAFT_1127692 [Heliocybe sulcata]|uniref:Uncharacterized protein n=1 Tax=Heliocybe sulcata TaxID=5364 RepID=A0A5C3N9G7_9AGAM|nr:hypothetical protein OE88DRAFT_1127692 [Heliocybe sulcata]